MELLFAVLGGILLGAVAHVVVPRRTTRGVLVAPAVGGIAAAVLWEALTWAGWPYDGTWIWVVALLGSAAVALVVAVVLGRRRTAADEAHYERLVKQGA
ncbi:hypothetical protein [Curtobacterium sp. MCBD17_032]|uniref:hypothetical protein n=1 Tax=Curtobacterium sp. MCBD17_032 TaxID=2175659 RepID=UPI000DA9A7A0|nr:hypothetical protein [Curtobacterium sp. MCBD17_032]PZE82412.1 hypothetical protein DEI91_11315 [Curtobacterium sp. MCBD17_032]